MKKQLQEKTVYKPNSRVTVTVVNKPDLDNVTGELFGYYAEVTVKYKVERQDKQLRFGSDDDIADFMGEIDYSEPQQSLL